MSISSAPLEARHLCFVLFFKALTKSLVLQLRSRLHLGIVAVWAGDVAILILVAMGATAPKTLEGAALRLIVWSPVASRGAGSSLILGKGPLGLAWISPTDRRHWRLRVRYARWGVEHMEALPVDAMCNFLDLVHLVLRLLSSSYDFLNLPMLIGAVEIM
jgi:hypothetical protein